MPPEPTPVIAFDFDGVLASYTGFIGREDVQMPNIEVVTAIKMLREQGYKILIHSTRGDEFLKRYCERFQIPVDYINDRPDVQGDNPKKPIAFVYVDDKAICYRGESAEELIKEITTFKPYWRQ